MIKVELGQTLNKGDIVTKDPQYGSQWKVTHVEGNIYSLCMHSKGDCKLEPGDTIIKIAQDLGEYMTLNKTESFTKSIITKIYDEMEDELQNENWRVVGFTSDPTKDRLLGRSYLEHTITKDDKIIAEVSTGGLLEYGKLVCLYIPKSEDISIRGEVLFQGFIKNNGDENLADVLDRLVIEYNLKALAWYK